VKRVAPLVLGAVLSLCAAAAAQEPAVGPEARVAAQALFEEGRQLRNAERWEEALAKFSASHRLDPAVGTLLNMADCYRQLGRTASAWLHYVDAVTIARNQGDGRRESYAREQALALEPRLARVVIEVEDPAPDLSVQSGGLTVERGQWGSAVPVDPGQQRIRAEAPGRIPWETTVGATPSATISVRIPPLALAPQPEPRPDPEPSRRQPDADTGHTTAIAGWVLASLGAAGVGVGIGFAVRARVVDDESDTLCPDDPDICLPDGADLRAEAQSSERVAIVALSTGGAALVAGAVLLVIAAVDEEAAAAASLDGDGVRIRW
jgi:hypothetical protein